MVGLLIAVLLIWMVACIWCGFQRRYVRFLAVLIAGLGVNMAWMVIGLNAQPFEWNALIAQFAALLYALCAFVMGWFAGRVRQAWRDSKIENGV